MSDKFVIVSVTLAVLFLASAAFFGQYMRTRRLMGLIEMEDNVRPDIKDVRYKCCEHCGLNFPEVGQSICEIEPDCHTVPCNEPGFCQGKEVAL